MEEQNFSEGCFLRVAEQFAVKDKKFILSIVSCEAVQETVHHCLCIPKIKFYCEDLHTSRIVAKMHHSGWGFCTEMNIMHRFD
jgi:hypothetical protein